MFRAKREWYYRLPEEEKGRDLQVYIKATAVDGGSPILAFDLVEVTQATFVSTTMEVKKAGPRITSEWENEVLTPIERAVIDGLVDGSIAEPLAGRLVWSLFHQLVIVERADWFKQAAPSAAMRWRYD